MTPPCDHVGVSTFFSADLHLGHAAVLTYSRRPFATVDHMNEALVDGWNETVTDDDEIWVLGDVALGKIDDTLALVSLLRGRKHLVAGNHDRPWHGHSHRADGWSERYLEAGFETIIQGTAWLKLGRRRVLLCHFPYVGDSAHVDRFVEHRPIDRGAWLLHGHVHQTFKQRGRMINVGVDAWNYRPVSESEIVGLIDSGPAHVAV
jgi:calcineurin-like phosphoesterase family protein